MIASSTLSLLASLLEKFGVLAVVTTTVLLGGADGTGCVTHKNIDGKPTRSQVIFSGGWQIYGGGDGNRLAMICRCSNSASPIYVATMEN